MARGINTKHHSQINENMILPCNIIWQRDVITSVRIHIVCVPTRTFPLLVVAVTLAYKRWSKGTGALKGVAQKKKKKCGKGRGRGRGRAQGHGRDPESSPSSRGQWRHMTQCKSAFCPVLFQAAHAMFFKRGISNSNTTHPRTSKSDI